MDRPPCGDDATNHPSRPDRARPTVSARVLVVAPDRVQRDLLCARLAGHVRALSVADGTDAARGIIDNDQTDLVLVCAGADEGVASACALANRRDDTPVVLMTDDHAEHAATSLLRHGVADLLPTGMPTTELLERLDGAARRGRAVRQRDRRIQRLRRLAQSVNQARRQITSNVSGLCTDLTHAYADLSDTLSQVSVAAEFNALLRQELDIESLLRCVLEYTLTKTGPTNAAVFLPSSSGDFTLGAYVNYDGPKDSPEILLDHLCGTLAPKFENSEGVQVLTGRDQIEARAPKAGDWLGDVQLVTFACRSAGECLAVVALFRDRRNPFGPSVVRTLGTMSELFAKQLARVVHIHHRHLPPSKWGTAWGSDPDDTAPDIDLAA